MFKIKIVLLVIILYSCNTSNQNRDESLLEIETKLKQSVEIFNKERTQTLVSPRSIENNSILMVPSKDWTSGFFPGELWIMYELTGDNYWKEIAIKYTLPLEQEKLNGKTHDMGFKMYCSYGRAWQNTNDPKYREILIQSAKTLAKRFQPNIGCIRSWDHNTDKWDYPVIIDNMMNLELLFWAANETGNKMYSDIAISHAKTTLKNHFRDDYSSYHVIDYNPETGEVQNKHTHQGYSHNSAWSRGQAWGLYGYTLVYRETKDPIFLQQAINIASYILNHPNLPKNLIPYWDFNAPNIPNEPYDVSAATVIGSALYELSEYTDEKEYLVIANKIFETLKSPEFLADPATNNGFLLKHSTGSMPHSSEIDVPLIYADYYFLEMMLRKTNLMKN
ncbi:glycoside hydrolase family 88 protein [Saccharicrinis aurantiacus]|uniref:glycoside hydrolase family 88 protein n=1 Tax=Saccharicrinis aurantiacus TaxID=1849719 RepID=UPI00248FB185|nr:glycoside hydrolase family 88 protein [Saccharicrinis aurantiacus]